MTPEEKRSAIQQYRVMVLAAIDYLVKQSAGSFVYDGEDPVTNYYQQQKTQTETYCKQGRLDRLQQKWTTLVKGPQIRADLHFAGYIKEKTGYEVDIFETLRTNSDNLITANKISSRADLNTVGQSLQYYQQIPGKEEMVEKIKLLLVNHAHTIKNGNIGFQKNKAEHREVIGREQKDGVEKVKVRISTGPKPKHFGEQVIVSPDQQRKLRIVQWDGGQQASTYVAIEFPASSGAIYSVRGIRPDIKAWWKDNATIVIETSKSYQPDTRHKELRSFDDTINVEYIEH